MIPQRLEFDYPKVDKTAYIYPNAVIIGRVKIGKNVFVAPGAIIRADEPESSIIISDNCNIQDRVIIHALKGSSVIVGENTSLAHGCIIHGPCIIGKNCFIGFGSVIFDAQIEDEVVVKHFSYLEKVKIPSRKFIPSGRIITAQKDANKLKCIDKEIEAFTKSVIKVNLDLIKRYKAKRVPIFEYERSRMA